MVFQSATYTTTSLVNKIRAESSGHGDLQGDEQDPTGLHIFVTHIIVIAALRAIVVLTMEVIEDDGQRGMMSNSWLTNPLLRWRKSSRL